MTKWNKQLLWLGKTLWMLAPDLLAAAGAVLITWGVWSIYPPGGRITAGLLCIAAAVLISKGGGGG